MGCEQTQRVKIYLGEDKTLNFQLKDDKGNFFDLTPASEIKVSFPSSLDAPIVKLLSTSGVIMVNALEGKFNVPMLKADSINLLVGAVIAVTITVTIAGLDTIIKIDEALDVEAP